MSVTGKDCDREREELQQKRDEMGQVLGEPCQNCDRELLTKPESTPKPLPSFYDLCAEAYEEGWLRRCIRNEKLSAVRFMTPSAEAPFWEEKYEGQALHLQAECNEQDVIDELKRDKTLLPWHHKFDTFRRALNFALGECPWDGEPMQSDVERGCDGTLRHTKRLLKMISGINIDSSLSALTHKGGSCDCQVFLTAIPKLVEYFRR